VTALAIVQIGHPTLRERAREVRDDELGSAELLRICDDLVETMRAANGAGIAAPQVDIPLRVFTVEVGDNPRYPYKPRLGLRVLVNPVVRPLGDETYRSYEGCLSIPDLRGLLPRATEVEVTYLDPTGTEHTERFGGLSAGTMQHELDHLDGILFPDRVEDPTTLCTWEMFRAYRQEEWVQSIQPLLERFPGERLEAEPPA
jgi:peptide deformylase